MSNPYILLFIITGLPNILCAIFIASPLAKNFIQRKSLFLGAILPPTAIVFGDLLPVNFEMIAIYVSFFVTLIIIITALIQFIRNRKHWSHYIFFIILAVGSIYAFWIFNELLGGMAI